MALTPMDITAQVRGLDPAHPDALAAVRGQVEVATTGGVIDSIALVPEDPPAAPAALEAIAQADWVFLGPGSWFTSVIPHLLVPALRDALLTTPARIVVVLNLAEQAGETPGFGAADHLAVLLEHAPALKVDTVLADVTSVGDGLADLQDAVRACGARLVLDHVSVADGSPRHDPVELARAYAAIMGG
jgi:uncharacterized cofD-like protein